MKNTNQNSTRSTTRANRISGTEFRLFLRDTLIARCKANPAYSLRALAKNLQLEPSFLSKLISGKRAITERTVRHVCSRLMLSPAQTNQFIQAPHTSSASVRDFQTVALDSFEVIADWTHYAILELLTVSEFRSEPQWIARRLGCKKIEIDGALERLDRLGMIARGSDGHYVGTPANHTTVGNEFTAVAFRKLQKQILTQALHALEEIPMEKRDQSSMTMAIDPELLPEAKRRLRDFRREFCAFLQENNRPRSEVYQLSLSFFPVSVSHAGAGESIPLNPARKELQS